jgi:RND family efflux transporter MFP subunit
VKIKKIIIGIVAVIAIVALGIKGKGLLESRKAEIANEALPSVQTITVPVIDAIQGDIKDSNSFLAKIASDKSIKLSTKLAGYIEKVFVEESQKVKKADPLVTIDDTELLSNIRALKATLSTQIADAKVAKSIYERNIKLYNIGGLAKEKLDISKVGKVAKASIIENTKQKIVQLQHQLSYLKIVAPFDGEIDNIILHEGDLAATGKPILTLSNGDKKLLFSFAPSSNKIKKGQAVIFKGKKIGLIKSIYNTSSNGLTTAEVTLSSTLEQPVGSSLTIEVITKESHGCIVPTNTLLHKKEGTFVMVYKDGKFSPLKIEIELKKQDKALISPCPNTPIAQTSEVKLATLPAYNNVEIVGANDE